MHFTGKTDELNPWQVARIRSRLVSYYFIRKNWYDATKRKINSTSQGADRQLEKDQKGLFADSYSWKQLARDIVYSPATNLTDLIDEDRLDASDDIHKDYGLPIRGDNLNKLFRGEPKTAKDGAKLRVIPKPNDLVIPSIYKFLVEEKYLSDDDLTQPIEWPSITGVFPDIETFPQSSYSPQIPFLLSRDFLQVGRKLNDGLILSLSTKRSDEFLQARLMLPRSHIRRLIETVDDGSDFEWSHNTWLWGWKVLIADDLAVLRVQSLERFGSRRIELHWVMVKNDATISRKGSDLNVINYLHSANPSSPSFFTDKASTSRIENLEKNGQIHLKVTNERNLTKTLQSFNISMPSKRSSSFLFSSGRANHEDETQFKFTPEFEESLSRRQFTRLNGGDDAMSKTDELDGLLNSYIRGESTEENKRLKDFFMHCLKPHSSLVEARELAKTDISTLTDPEKMSDYFFFCISWSSVPNIDQLVTQGMDINWQHPVTGGTALHVIAETGAARHLRELIKQPDLNYLIKADGLLPSQVALQQPCQNNVIARFLRKKEMQQARNSIPQINYEALMLGENLPECDAAP